MNLKGTLVDAETNEFRVMEIKDELETFYRLLHCTTIDAARRDVDGCPVLVICDDEGLLKDNPKVSAINGRGEPAFVGSLFVISAENNDGAFVSLSEQDCEFVLRHVAMLPSSQNLQPHPILLQVEYPA